MEEGLKKLVGVTLAVAIAAAVVIYVLRPATGPSTSSVENPACSDHGAGEGKALGHDKTQAAAKATDDRGKGHASGQDRDRPARDESKGPNPCHDPTMKKADKADKALRHGDPSGRRHEV
jgi:hypothetical protein